MSTDSIKCPNCGKNIAINEILSHRLTEQVNEKVSEKLEKEKAVAIEILKKQFADEQNSNLKKLQVKLTYEETRRKEAEKKEMEFLKKQNELEDQIKQQDLVVARKLSEEKKLVEEKTRKEEQEKQNFKNLELQKQLNDTKKALAEAQRKAQQGSMQTQGEVVELSLEGILKQNFPNDQIAPVPKGISGADITQRVLDRNGNMCGVIAWESKQTQNWTEGWVQKLKDDSRNIKANIAILVSATLPKEITRFGHYKGVWICDFSSIVGLTTALRHQLIAVAKTTSIQSGKEEKKDILYNYLCGQTFSHRVEAIVESFLNMKSSLEIEKTAMNKIWATREQQISQITENTAKMFGDIQGIAGLNMPNVEILELETLAQRNLLLDEKPKSKKKQNDSDQFNLFKK